MKKTTLLLAIIIFFSCQEDFNPKNYKGNWFPYNDSIYKPLPHIIFKNDSIFFNDINSFIKGGKFKIKKNQIIINFEFDSLIKDISFRKKDSLLLFDGNKYFLYDYLTDEKLIQYKLIGIDTKSKISIDSLRRFEAGFHIIKDTNDSVRLKINDQLTKFSDIPAFVFNQPVHFDILCTPIYLGENIELKDLIKSYYQLVLSNRPIVALITNFNLEKNEYDVHIEKIEIWNEQITNHFKSIIDYHEFDINNRVFFINKYKPISIIINSSKDFNSIDTLDDKYNYLISINDKLPLTDYIYFKEKLLEVRKERKTKIRTEIIKVPPNS